MSDLLKKKKQPEVSQIPNFDHDNKDVSDAIGVTGLIQSISDKMNELSIDSSITSPSRAVEYFYNNFNLIELSFMAMHSLGRQKEEEKEEESVPFEEVV